MGNWAAKLLKTLMFAAFMAAGPLVAVHAENNERWGDYQNWQGENWHDGGNGGYGGNYDNGGSFYLNGGPGYYYPPPPTYYYPPPQPYYPPPQPYYAQPYYPPAPDYYGPQFGLQFNFPLR